MGESWLCVCGDSERWEVCSGRKEQRNSHPLDAAAGASKGGCDAGMMDNRRKEIIKVVGAALREGRKQDMEALMEENARLKKKVIEQAALIRRLNIRLDELEGRT